MGRNLLWEVKTESGTMTDSETTWHETWRGSVDIVWTVEQALDILDRIARA